VQQLISSRSVAMAGFCYHSLSRAFLLHSIAHLLSSIEMTIALHASNSICLLLRVALHIYNLLGPRDGVWQRSFSSAVAFKRQSWGFRNVARIRAPPASILAARIMISGCGMSFHVRVCLDIEIWQAPSAGWLQGPEATFLWLGADFERALVCVA
jgi:hypothetical protein